MQNNSSNNKLFSSTAFIVAGALMMFLGFVFPGWLWLTNTPGDVEMLPLAGILLLGVAGIPVLIIGIVKRNFEKRKSNGTEAK